VRLVDRTSHGVALTPAGEAFRVEAEWVVRWAARAVHVARAAARGRTGTVTIGYNHAAANTVVPTLARLAADHPRVQPQLGERRSGPQLEALLSDELDVGFVYGHPRSALVDSRELLTTWCIIGAWQPDPKTRRRTVRRSRPSGSAVGWPPTTSPGWTSTCWSPSTHCCRSAASPARPRAWI
jgi:DNA-binding transcriptional LysR family regulator